VAGGGGVAVGVGVVRHPTSRSSKAASPVIPAKLKRSWEEVSSSSSSPIMVPVSGRL